MNTEVKHTCSGCLFWGIDERGYSRPALMKPVGQAWNNKLCMKQSGKYTRDSFSCDNHVKAQP